MFIYLGHDEHIEKIISRLEKARWQGNPLAKRNGFGRQGPLVSFDISNVDKGVRWSEIKKMGIKYLKENTALAEEENQFL
jgi:hypothetical protein